MNISTIRIGDRGISQAALDVLNEVWRQEDNCRDINDDDYVNGELASAAASYAMLGSLSDAEYETMRAELNYLKSPRWSVFLLFAAMWPKSWSWEHFKPKGQRFDLVRSAALAIKAIELYDRQNGLENDEIPF